jgi:hypothetical protein
MGIGINDIVGKINEYKLLLPNKYKITLPYANDISFHCHTVTIPGKSIATEEWFRYGPTKNIPYQLLIEDLSTTFYLDDKLKGNKDVYELFNNIGKEGIKYYDDIIQQLDIEIYDREGNTSSNITIDECFPTAISTVELSYNSESISEATITWYVHNFD